MLLQVLFYFKLTLNLLCYGCTDEDIKNHQGESDWPRFYNLDNRDGLQGQTLNV